MNKISLFEISKEQLELINMIEESTDLDGEVDEITEAALQINKEQYIEKAVDYIAVIEHQEAKIERAKLAEKQIKAYKDRAQRVVDNLKRNLQSAVVIFGPTEAGFHKLSLRKSEELIIENSEKIPGEYLDKKVVITPDKMKIKKAIKAGEEIEGVYINVKQNLQIK